MLSTEPNLAQLHGTLEHHDNALSDDEKWKAVLSRDDSFDGAFVFAVRSTGIYCRPSCSARRPSKEHVVFFPGSVEAEQSGFRACHRCKPHEAGLSPRDKLLDQVCRYIDANLQQKLTLAILSRQVGLSRYYFQRTFKRVLGISPRQYIKARRLARMKRFLRDGETVNNSLYNAGFSSRSRVYENVPGGFGVNPGEFRRGGEGLRIRYSIIGSPLGRLLVAATERGVCGVCIGDSDAFVERSLAEDYPSAVLYRTDQEMKEWTGAFARYFRGDNLALNLPLDVRATAFQSRVWKIIQRIPFGKTTTYGRIAKELGAPDASRAVARACATNPVALVIPCHRVIGKNGSLRGYRWGKKRKQTLLELEKNSNLGTMPKVTC
jgi:AraC family transcriptional regulator, regulatory protein of adaptative response / methylated-DNA-[protein]-cysteine methyltransferase